jgi:RNA polymerase sigma-70 factor (ECF subfamily)
VTDEEIVAKIIKGDKRLYGEILDRYEKKIYFYLRRLTGWDQLSIEDMVQDTFIKVYKNLASFDLKLKFSSWIYRIAHNVGVDFLKTQKKTANIDDLEEVLASKQTSVEDLAIAEVEKDLLKNALKKMDWKYREVILLYYLEERSYEEISDILQIPVSTAGVLLMRAKKKLKELLTKNE